MLRIFTAAAAAAFLAAAPASALTIDIGAQSQAGTTVSQKLANYVDVALGAGSWDLTYISGAYKAWNAWGAVQGCDGSGANCSRGYLTSFEVLDAGGAQLLSVASAGIFESEVVALSAAQLNGAVSLTLASAQTVYIGISDSALLDNIGGLSLEIAAAADVPAPAAGGLLAAGLAGIAALRRRRA